MKEKLINEFYWAIIAVIYLLWSFIFSSWNISWIIWPVAALLSTGLNLFWVNYKK